MSILKPLSALFCTFPLLDRFMNFFSGFPLWVRFYHSTQLDIAEFNPLYAPIVILMYFSLAFDHPYLFTFRWLQMRAFPSHIHTSGFPWKLYLFALPSYLIIFGFSPFCLHLFSSFSQSHQCLSPNSWEFLKLLLYQFQPPWVINRLKKGLL